MKPAETIAFFESQITRGEKGLSAAKAAGNSSLLALNVRQLFKARLMRGLVMWRHGANPTAEFFAAVDTVDVGQRELSAGDAPLSSEVDLPLARAALLARLIGKSSGRTPSAETSAVPEKHLDWLLLANARPADVRSQAEVWLQALADTEGAALAVKTYRNYFDILEQASEDRVAHAARAFERRALDRYYVGAEQTEGGGQDNALVVDYRLAVVLRRVDYRGESIHLWRWDNSDLT